MAHYENEITAHDLSRLHERDLESQELKKEPGVTVTQLDSTPHRPVLGRRKTTGSLNGIDGPGALADDSDEDALTKIGNFLSKIHSASIITRYALYILPVSALLAIPLIIFATVKADERADGIRLLGLFIWIEVIWLALWVCKLVAQTVPLIFQMACGLISTGIRKYSLVLKALEIPLSVFFWTIVAWGTSSLIYVFDQGKHLDQATGTMIQPQDKDWVKTVQMVFKAGIIVAAIFLVEKTIMQLVSINYHRKQYDHKIRESKRMIRMLDLLYDASRKLFPEFCREFQEEDSEIQSSGLNTVRTQLQKAGMETRIFSDMHRVRDKVTAALALWLLMSLANSCSRRPMPTPSCSRLSKPSVHRKHSHDDSGYPSQVLATMHCSNMISSKCWAQTAASLLRKCSISWTAMTMETSVSKRWKC